MSLIFIGKDEELEEKDEELEEQRLENFVQSQKIIEKGIEIEISQNANAEKARKTIDRNGFARCC